MTGSSPNGPLRPPRIARWLLAHALPADVRDAVSGDLEEMFHRRRERDGKASARVWYWRQAASFATRFAAERLRDRWRGADMSTGFSWIDFTLAIRMLVRYPGLTLVSAVGMAVGIAIAVATFTVADALIDTAIPLDQGDRIVSIVNWDVATNNREQRVAREFSAWRDQLPSLEDIGAFRVVGRNLIAPGTQPETISVTEISASGFRIARVAAARGRHVLPEDEQPGARAVVVISDEVWRRRFGGDPSIVGREIRLGSELHTIVGVMPPGFAFPVSDNFWVPLRLRTNYEPRSGPVLNVFGRLAPGATLDSAQPELTAVSERMAAESPKTHEHLRARVLPYTYAFTDMDDPDNGLALHAMRVSIVMLLVVVCVNVAILVYARTATRQGEIAVRTALGASRRRIIAQLFAEALALAGFAAIIGVGLVSLVLTQLDGALAQMALTLPFWMKLSLSTRTIAYVIGLTLLAAAIVGVLPAIKATGRSVQGRLQGLSAGSGSRMHMGRLWTLLIVMQVALAVAMLPATVYHAWNSLRVRTGDRGFASQQFLTADLYFDRSTGTSGADPAFRSRYADRLLDLQRRLQSEPAIESVTFSLVNPGSELAAVLEADGVPAPAKAVDYNIVEGSKQGRLVRFNRVSSNFFDAFGVPVLMGRELPARDADTVLVDRTFVNKVLGGANPLGRRVRYVGRSREAGEGNLALGRWYEIVGVVADFPPRTEQTDGSIGRVYHAVSPADVYPAVIALRVRGGSPSAFAGRLREVTAAVDPALQLRDVASFADVARREQGLLRLIGFTLIAVTMSVVVLSAAGIYALMSFTVARRRKEIGIRAALGADASRILAGVFSRALAQLGAGAALGILAAIGLEQVLEGEMFQGHGAVILPSVAFFMTAVGMIAAWAPARRGLRIQPVEALREE
jgi:predicted permease